MRPLGGKCSGVTHVGYVAVYDAAVLDLSERMHDRVSLVLDFSC